MSEPMTPEQQEEILNHFFGSAANLFCHRVPADLTRIGHLLTTIDSLRAANKEAETEFLKERARVKELEEAQRWRPIETVPRDGTRVLIGWFELPGQRTLAIAGWNSTLKAWSNTWMAFSSDPRDQPTHWMPLPQTPVDRHTTQSGTDVAEQNGASPNQDDVAEQSRESREFMGGTK